MLQWLGQGMALNSMFQVK
uniref:Uncharacterized protein n=1 Tax=Anguilla anguilla TaxID=7936 RepID=A0A0E9UPZ8_ANGAN